MTPRKPDARFHGLIDGYRFFASSTGDRWTHSGRGLSSQRCPHAPVSFLGLLQGLVKGLLLILDSKGVSCQSRELLSGGSSNRTPIANPETAGTQPRRCGPRTTGMRRATVISLSAHSRRIPGRPEPGPETIHPANTANRDGRSTPADPSRARRCSHLTEKVFHFVPPLYVPSDKSKFRRRS